ncbi:hypothetical protein Tco_0181290, partial [Tanacetum coccineum]
TGKLMIVTGKKIEGFTPVATARTSALQIHIVGVAAAPLFSGQVSVRFMDLLISRPLKPLLRALQQNLKPLLTVKKPIGSKNPGKTGVLMQESLVQR